MTRINEPSNDPDAEKAPGFLQALLSVVAAAFGVQNSKTRERDFTHGSPLTFIIAGLVFTLLFVLGLILVVSIVLS